MSFWACLRNYSHWPSHLFNPLNLVQDQPEQGLPELIWLVRTKAIFLWLKQDKTEILLIVSIRWIKIKNAQNSKQAGGGGEELPFSSVKSFHIKSTSVVSRFVFYWDWVKTLNRIASIAKDFNQKLFIV